MKRITRWLTVCVLVWSASACVDTGAAFDLKVSLPARQTIDGVDYNSVRVKAFNFPYTSIDDEAVTPNQDYRDFTIPHDAVLSETLTLLESAQPEETLSFLNFESETYDYALTLEVCFFDINAPGTHCEVGMLETGDRVMWYEIDHPYFHGNRSSYEIEFTIPTEQTPTGPEFISRCCISVEGCAKTSGPCQLCEDNSDLKAPGRKHQCEDQ